MDNHNPMDIEAIKHLNTHGNYGNEWAGGLGQYPLEEKYQTLAMISLIL